MSTALHRNPFHVLGATPQDSGARLLELAEERTLIADPEACQAACTQLVSPRTRLTAELGWFPGVPPRDATLALEWLDRSADTALSDALPPLARANLMAADVERTTGQTDRAVAVRRVVDLARTIDGIDLQTLLQQLNADRSIAKVPPVRDADAITGELETQRRYYMRVVRDMLDKLPTRELIQVMSEAVGQCTERGTRPAPRLVQDLGDAYELEAQAFVAGEAANIEHLLMRAQADAMQGEAKVLPTVDALSAVAANWTLVTKPMQVLRRANGIDHAASGAVAARMRNLGIWLRTQRRMTEPANRISALLRREFSSLIELSGWLDEDSRRLAQRDEFERAMSYSADIGQVFPKWIAISPAGLSWQNNVFKLEDIVAIRWGATWPYETATPLDTACRLGISLSSGYSTSFDLRNAKVFSEIVPRLWRTVGLRLVMERVRQLRQGGSIGYQDVVVEDAAVTLPRGGTKDAVRLTWPEVAVRSEQGNFVIGAAADLAVHAALSYQKDNNLPVLEHLIRAALQTGQTKLSAVLT